MRFHRRHALRLAAGGLGLRALATGLPASFLLRPHQARAQAATPPQFLVLAVSSRGDPLNANAPGSFVEGVVNNPLAEMAPVDFELGPVRTRAARPWSTLGADLRSRLGFMHLRTGVVTHPSMNEVLELRGAVTGESGNRGEMLPSMLAAEAAPLLETVLSEPIPLGAETLSARGLPLDSISPPELKDLFSSAQPGLAQLADLRDASLDAIYAEVRGSGTPAQRDFLDRFALGRNQARQLGEELSALLERVVDTPLTPEAAARDQLLAAVALFRLNVTPVVTVNVPFGGDNHQDDSLEQEADEHASGVGLIQTLFDELKAVDLQDRVTFATLNVFGRTLQRNAAGGRDHNGDHHVLAAFGSRVRPGVFGGLQREGDRFVAGAIDPATGAMAPDGAIPADETLLAAGHTLMSWLNLPEETAARRLAGGQGVAGMVVTAG
ncbi:MAG: DUF1501 domain-containing protein [Myxococcota bacterium]